MVSWFFIHVFYFLGVPVERLAHWYLPIRSLSCSAVAVEKAESRGIELTPCRSYVTVPRLRVQASDSKEDSRKGHPSEAE
jgi:hypothetical protein